MIPAAAAVAGITFVTFGFGMDGDSSTAHGATTEEAKKEPTLTVPKVFYARPVGDSHGLPDKMPFHLRFEDESAPRPPGKETGRLTMDISGHEKAVKLKKVGRRCTGTVKVTCKVGQEYDNWADWGGAVPAAAAGGKPGDTGVLRIRYAAPDGTVRTARTRVVVGEPVLEARWPETIAKVKPGSRISQPLTIRNTGEVTAQGIGLHIGTSEGLTNKPRYGNCRYPKQDPEHIMSCELPDLRIPPGKTVTLSPALGIDAPKTLMYSDFHMSLWPMDMGPQHYSSGPVDGEKGDGPDLKPGGAPAQEGTWTGKGEKWARVQLDTHADYEAIGGSLRGKPGTVRKIDVGVRNNGPGDTGDVNSGGSTSALDFTVPKGSKVVKQPMEEIDDGVFEPLCKRHERTYTCPLNLHEPGKEQKLGFTLRIGGKAAGTVHIRDDHPATGRKDNKPANDTARVTTGP